MTQTLPVCCVALSAVVCLQTLQKVPLGDSIESTPTLPKIRIPRNQPLLVLLHSSDPEVIGFNHFFSVVTLEKV